MALQAVTLVLLATAWGPRHGGINALNVELARSLGVMPQRAFNLVCVVPQASAEDFADAARHHVQLEVLGHAAPTQTVADAVLGALGALALGGSLVWLGHDDKTGPLALALRARCPGSRLVLMHHMAFGAYQSFKKDDSAQAKAKSDEQRHLFQQADLCLAIGPLLQQQLTDLLGTAPGAPPVAMLVPGLADPDPDQVRLTDQPPHNFTAFLGGRLGSDDDRIKQALLGVRAFGAAAGMALDGPDTSHPMRRSPTLRMRGVPPMQHATVQQVLDQAAGRVLNSDLADYTEDRTAYFSDLASSSVALMPSWHEGFGLAAWEAIACQVPVVIGEQSGVYRLLHDQCQRVGLGASVHATPVQGRRPSADNPAPHTEQDVQQVRDALLAIGRHIHTHKTNAAGLAAILKRNFRFTWEQCAADLVAAAEAHLALTLRQHHNPPPPQPGAQQAASPRPGPLTSGVPAFLTPPAPQAWQPGQLAPSALLLARDKVVRFHPVRQALVQQLLAPMADAPAPPITLQLLTGPGGIGKTRTALELLSRASAAGWQGLWLPADLPADLPANLPTDALAQWKGLLATAETPLLLVVDYAEGRQPTLLQWLDAALDAGAARRGLGGLRLHLLCLARGSTWWAGLPRQPGCSERAAALLAQASVFTHTDMPGWPQTSAARASAYQAALQDFAKAQGLPAPAQAWQPELGQPLYARPLYLHLAALAALAGERPGHGHALLQAQLLREWRHWQRLPGAPLQDAQDYDDWADALAWLALVQGADLHALGAALSGLGIAALALLQPLAQALANPLANPLAQALRRSYPDAVGGVAPLQPDLLAEQLIVERLGAARGGQLAALALAGSGPTVTRALLVVARLAQPPAGPGAVDPAPALPAWQQTLLQGLAQAWRQHARLMVAAMHAQGKALSDWLLAAWRRLPQADRAALAGALALPHYSTPLLGFSVEVARLQLDAASDTAARANALNTLAVRLSDQGDAASRVEALTIARQAVSVYRALADEQPAAYRPDLARSLNNLASFLSAQGDAASRAEALAIAREAVSVYRALADEQPAAYRPDLAMSLNNLANRLSEQGDAASRAEALAFAREAVLLFEMAYAESPSAFERNLNIAVQNLGRIAAAEGLDPQAEINAVPNPALSQARDGREDAATPKTKG